MREEDYLILTQGNVKMCAAEMIYHNVDRAAFLVHSSILLVRISKMKKVRFHRQEEYAEIFEAEVYQVKEGRLFLEKIKNVTADLRSDLKMRVSYESTVRSLDGLSRMNVHIHAKDISCGGLCFQTEEDLMKTELYETVIPITKDPIIVNLKIVRKIYDKEKKVYVYGCRFIELNNNQERLLRQAIFRLQMIARKKIKPSGKEA